MSEDQELFYKSVLERERQGVMDLIDSRGLERSRVSILAAITCLRWAACHPCLVGGDKVPSSKIDTFLDLVDELISEGHRALVFSSFTVPRSGCQEVEDRGYTYQYLTAALVIVAVR